jgi:PIN domain nuclease of toxin-antitoxin system
MKYLLDTHTFIWLDNSPKKLPEKVISLCSDPDNQLFLSMASVWEMQIKIQLGKLKLNAPLADTITAQREANGVQLLSIELAHILELAALPDYHKDPFDRLIIAQTRLEGAELVTDDDLIAKYPVTVVW